MGQHERRNGQRRIPPKTREAILASLLAGESQHKTAKLYKVSPATVNAMAKQAGLNGSTEHSPTKKANEARVAYSLERRLELSNRIFERLAAAFESDELEPAKLYQLIMGYAVAVDKRRLEDGQVTARSESVDPRAAIERGREHVRLLRGGPGG